MLCDFVRREKSQLPCEVREQPHEDRESEGEKEREREKIWGKKLGCFCGVFYIEEHKIAG